MGSFRAEETLGLRKKNRAGEDGWQHLPVPSKKARVCPRHSGRMTGGQELCSTRSLALGGHRVTWASSTRRSLSTRNLTPWKPPPEGRLCQVPPFWDQMPGRMFTISLFSLTYLQTPTVPGLRPTNIRTAPKIPESCPAQRLRSEGQGCVTDSWHECPGPGQWPGCPVQGRPGSTRWSFRRPGVSAGRHLHVDS